MEIERECNFHTFREKKVKLYPLERKSGCMDLTILCHYPGDCTSMENRFDSTRMKEKPCCGVEDNPENQVLRSSSLLITVQ